MKDNQHIIQSYIQDISALKLEEQKLDRKSTIFSALRLIVFVTTIILIIVIIPYGAYWPILLGILGVATFLIVVKRHHSMEQEKKLVQTKVSIAENEINTLSDRNNQYYDGSVFIDEEHNFSTDLDVFGPFSLFGLINRAQSYDGLRTLAKYLTNYPSPDQIERQRNLIKDLEGDKQWRTEFLASLYDIKDGHVDDMAAIVNKILDTDFSFATTPILTYYRRSLPFIWALLILLYFLIPGMITPIAIIIALVNFKITMGYANKVTHIQFRLSKASYYLDNYARALRKIYERSWISTELINQDTQQNSENRVVALSKLKKLSDLLDYRLHMIPSFVLNVGVLWDSKIVANISTWKGKNHDLIDGVFDLIGNVEALISLSHWSFNHPHFCYPEVDREYFHLEGIDLRHPILSFEQCVPNNFKLQNGDYINIITGSNMSGKSTFLRTLGLNIILSYTGTRVNASKFSLGLVCLVSYMRIKDALEENVSTFKAELNRISKILKLMKSELPVLILADEMLRGTNSNDKLKGSRAIILKILEYKSYAVVATHDISLTDLSKIDSDHVKNYFFDIDYAKGELIFDYKIKEGICENFNASFLLNQLGIEVGEDNFDKL